MVLMPTMGRARDAARRAPRSRRAEMRLEPLEQRQMLDAAYINEIYIDPPSGGDAIHEYVELRGTPGMSLDDHYLIFIENENNAANTGNPGEIEMIFNLDGLTMGSNGFLVSRQGGNSYSVAAGTTELGYVGQSENSGGTYMLIKTDGTPGMVPTLGFDLDAGNNGLDNPNGRAGWTIVDSIGIHGEAGEAFYGRLYGKINFGPEASTNIEPGATYVGVGFEIEYAGRWGNSTGQTAADWHVSNLTDNVLSGFQDEGDFRQSADPHGSENVESNKGVPYGTNITGTLGAPNIGPATEVYINEIYLDPPSGGDIINEYIELRGTPNMPLDDYFLIFVENENDVFNEGGAGEVERVFDLTGLTMGSNGFLVFHQAGHPYSIAPGTTTQVYTGVIENSGFTAMLIKNNGGLASEPFVDDITPLDLDANNDGLDVASGNIAWDIKDSIGLHSENDELEFGVLYGLVNYGPGPAGIPIPNYVDVGFEIEYVGRWGNSTGSAPLDWHVSNLTDNVLSGFQDTGDFRQSAEPHGSANVESNQGVPYGTNLTNTLGAANYPVVVTPPATIAGRHIFYNNSKFDGNTAGVSVSDDAAIAPDRSPYFAGGGIAPLSSITSYSKGINGIMVDIEDAAGTLTVDDFTFKVGSNNSLGSWTNAPAPQAFSVRPGAGMGGSDRVEIIWADGAIKNIWLQVIVEGNDATGGMNANTGLAASDVFFFGNKVGDTQLSSPATVVTTSAGDELAARQNPGVNVGITNIYDFDKNNLVSAGDQLAARSNAGLLTRISIAAPPAAPLVAGDATSAAVASALATSKVRSSDTLGARLNQRGQTFELKAAAVAKAFAGAMESEQAREKAVKVIERIGEVTGIDDGFVDALLAELGLG